MTAGIDNRELADFPPAQVVTGSDLVYTASGQSLAEQATTVTQLQNYIISPIANSTLNQTASLNGNETVPIGKSGLFQTTLNKIALWIVNAYQGYTSSATGAVAQTLQSKLQDTFSLKDFGAKGDGVTNDDVAITNWLAALQTGMCGYIPSGIYVFTTRKIAPLLNNISIRGDGARSSVFLYAGTDAATDLFTVGDGVLSMTGWSFTGFRIDSSTVMTSGAALRIRRMQNGSNLFDVDAGLLSGNRNLWDGIWLDNVNICKYTYGNISTQNEGLKMNGSSTNDEGSDIYLDDLVISYCGVGYHVGGGQGGVYFGKTLAFGNGTNYRVDNGLATRLNREIFFSSECVSDGCKDYGIHINDTLTGSAPISMNAFVGSAGLIGAGGAGVCIYVQSWPAGRITMGAGQLFNATSHGMRVDDTTTYIDIDSARHIFNNGGYGIYAPNVTSNISYEGRAWQNALGNFSPNSNVGAWTSFNITPFAASGTIASASGYGRYRLRGKTIEAVVVVDIITNGTGAGSVNVTMPFQSYDFAIGKGRENAVIGKGLQAIMSANSANLSITNDDNTYPGATGYKLIVSIVYETV
ncbi:glycosyl hydrolase family 28-related protein [Burkholderia sp. GS2Y]|uniref:Glycosyl hydrolase family 28-related protein n=1 Tax=Burkholderia theae TaxID=3143496 RepID=A0ABU9WNH3_9BURK